MKNLKRVLSLALSGIMLVGMMAVGASAVDAKDFTDASEINNKDAVSTMSALGVILGKDTGAFDPKGNVTRAELAKMICVAMNGGKDPVLGTKATPTYTDIKGHWAESYIEYCSSLGYVSGRGNGAFDPAGNVTSTEAAKIILGALGYKADVSGLTGADWAINTNVIANGADVDLYDGLETIDTNAPMNREDAAQMLYNALNAKMVAHNGTSYVNTTYGLDDVEERVTGTKRVYKMTIKGSNLTEASLNGMKFDSVADADAMAKAYYASAAIGTDYTLEQVEEDVKSISAYTRDVDETFGHKFLNLITYSTSDNTGYVRSVNKEANRDTYRVELGNGRTFTRVKTDYSDLMGQKVKVLYKATDNVYGIYAHADSEVLFEGVVDNIDVKTGNTVELSGTSFKTDAASAGSTVIYRANDFAGTTYTLGSTTGLDRANSIKAIDNNADGKIDLVVVMPTVVAKVTYKGNNSITVNPAVAGNSSLDLEDDVIVYDGIAKNDYVIATPAANTASGKIELVKAETVTGAADGLRKDSATSANTTVRVDGTWYKKATATLANSKSIALNDDVDLVLMNGYYAFADVNASTTKDLAVLLKIGAPNVANEYEAILAFTDNTTATVRAKIDGKSTMAAGTDDGKFYTYEVNNGVYTLKVASTANTGYDDLVTGVKFVAANDKIGTFNVADDAVVIVRYKHSTSSNTGATTVTTGLSSLTKTTFITGKTLKSLSNDFGATAHTQAFVEKVNGIDYARVIFLAADAQDMIGSDADKYGYIVSTPYQTKDGGDTFVVFDLWDGENVIEGVRVKDNSSPIPAKYGRGTAITYSDLGDGKIETVSAISATGSIIGYNANDKLISILTSTGAVDANAAKVNNDTVYIYIDSEKREGVPSDDVNIIEANADGSYDQNVIYVGNSSNNTVKVLFIDVNNKLAGQGALAQTAPDATVSTAGNGLSVADVRAMADGVYKTTNATKHSDFSGDNFGDVTKVMFFKFTSTGTQNYVLSIKNAAGTEVYKETATTITDSAAHIFYVDTVAPASSIGDGNAYGGATLGAAGTYTFTITAADGTVLVSGAYQL